MDKKKIEMAAEEYTAKHFLNDAEHLLKDPWPEARERYKKTLIRFATIALSHQWVSVEDALPEPHEEVLCRMKSNDAVVSGFIFRNKKGIPEVATDSCFHFEDYEEYEPTHWCPIPPLNPDDKLPTPTDL